MKQTAYFLITLVISLIVVMPTGLSFQEEEQIKTTTSGQYDKGYRYNIRGWVYIHIEGDPYERGYQYGYLASAEIEDIFQRWANLAHDFKFMKIFIFKSLPKNYDKLSEQWWKICKTKSMKTFEKHVPEEYKQEMMGMVDGLNAKGVKLFGKDIQYEDIVASQFVQDVWYAFYLHSYKRFHPLRSLVNGVKDLLSGGFDKQDLGHCHAFIATGDSTEDGGIVVAHATIFQNYIAQRCNFIVDVKPSNGYRFIMTGPPGSLWSQEDWYQNEKGIILTETELMPQGPFNIRKTPKGVRSRIAIQYSASIDEVIKNLQNGNSGLIPNEWLIGDTKTGEIARFEQALFNTPVTRTKNGFFWSCCVPHSDKVERELWGLLPKFIALKIYPNKYENPAVGKKFEELEKEYHGQINTEVAKIFMTTPPISNGPTDCKITSSKLMENMGLVAFFGKTEGFDWNPPEEFIKNYKGVTTLPVNGWLEIYDSNFNQMDLQTDNKNSFYENDSKILWKFEPPNPCNMNYSMIDSSEDVIFSVDNSGEVNAFDAKLGKTKWNKLFESKITDIDVSERSLFIGTNEGLYALDKESGAIGWEQKIGQVVSKPVLYNDVVIAGFLNGEVRGFDRNSGEEKWSYGFSDRAYVSENANSLVYIAAGKSCYGFDPVKEEIVWEFESEKLITSSPKTDEETVYFGSWGGCLYALDCLTGDVKWNYQTGWGIDSTPAVSDDMVYFGSLDNNFYALNKEKGELVWYFNCKSAIHSNPVVYGDYVFFGCDDGRFYALNKTNGDYAWSFTPGYFIKDGDANNYVTTPILSNPVAKDGIVYFSAKGVVYALDAQTYERTEKTSQERVDVNYELISLILIFAVVVILLVFLYSRKKKNKDDGGEK